jgi:DNA-binding NtrC family response regulator
VVGIRIATAGYDLRGCGVRLLLVFPDSDLRDVLVHVVTAWHPRIQCCYANTADEAVDRIGQDSWSAVVVAARFGGDNADGLLPLLGRLRAVRPQTPIIVATEQMDAGEATAATRGLASAYVDLNTPDPLLAVLQREDAMRRHTTGVGSADAA